MKTNNCLVKLQPINAELRLPDLAKGMLLLISTEQLENLAKGMLVLNSTEQLENLKFFIFKRF